MMSGECFSFSSRTFNDERTCSYHISRFKKQFSTYLADGVGSEDIEEVFQNAHAAIREDPTFQPSEKTKDWKAESLKYKTSRLTHAQRKTAIEAKIQAFKAGGDAVADGDEDEDDEK
jgi:large subunit ribosomal protein L5e